MRSLLAVLAWLSWTALAYADPLVPTTAPGSASATLTVGSTAISGGGAGQLMYDNTGVLGETTGLTATNTSLTITGGSLVLTGSQSAAAWTTNGLRLKGVSGTLTDTTSSGTVAAQYTDVLGGNTIAASSATTYTEYDAVHFKAPVAGTNVTFTNSFALGADSVSFGTSNPFRVTTAGAATATSLAVGGATLAGNALAVTGTVSISGLMTSGSLTSFGSNNFGGALFNGGNVTQVGALFFNTINNVALTGKAAATLQLGAADAAAAVAQTLGVQSVVAGTSNTAGALWKHVGSLATGSGVSGDISFQTGGTGAGATAQNTAVDALVIKGATQNIRLPAITSDAALTDSTVCQDTTNHALFSGSGTLGICLGTSSARYKHDVSDLGLGLHAIMGLQPKRYFLDRQHGDPTKPYYGFLAEDGVGVLPELVGNDNIGRPNTFDYLGIVPILVRAVQEQQVEIETLRRMVR